MSEGYYPKHHEATESIAHILKRFAKFADELIEILSIKEEMVILCFACQSQDTTEMRRDLQELINLMNVATKKLDDAIHKAGETIQ